MKLSELKETYLTDELFMLIKNSPNLNSPIDWSKFIAFLAIMIKGTRDEKLQLFFSLFNKIPDNKLSKSEMKTHITGTLLSMALVNFEDVAVEVMKQ